MTIPEAVQLILHASLLPEVRGSIAMLMRGEPVRITGLARNLLQLSGMHRVSGNHVVYTGLPPGERLHEELTAPDKEKVATANAKVRIIRAVNGTGRSVSAVLESWEAALQDGRDAEVLRAVAEPCGALEASRASASPMPPERVSTTG